MRYAIIGVGGVGGLVGGLLARAGFAVTFVARGEHGQAMRSSGLTVRSVLGDFHVGNVDVRESVSELGEIDVVLVCVKGWQLATVAAELRDVSGDVVIPLLNGVDSTSVLASAIGAKRTCGGLCRMVSELQGPGVIHHWAVPPSVICGELNGRRSARLLAMAAELKSAGVETTVVPVDESGSEIHAAIWEKAAFISSWGALCAARGSAIGAVRESPEDARMLRMAVEEIVAVGRAEGVRLPADVVERTMSAIASLDPAATSSLQRDVTAGRASELDWQVGAIIRRGHRTGVPVTTLERILGEVAEG